MSVTSENIGYEDPLDIEDGSDAMQVEDSVSEGSGEGDSVAAGKHGGNTEQLPRPSDDLSILDDINLDDDLFDDLEF